MDMMRLRPKDMPKLREVLQESTTRVYESHPGVTKQGPGLHFVRGMTRSLSALSLVRKELAPDVTLYWVSPEMTLTCIEASQASGAPIAEVTMTVNPSGLAHFAGDHLGGIHSVAWTASRVSDPDGMVSGESEVNIVTFDSDGNPMTVGAFNEEMTDLLPIDGSHLNEDDFLRKFILAFLSLSQTPTAASATTRTVPGTKIKGQRRRQAPSEVKVVELRAMKHQTVTHSPSGRKYHHRWVVRGHWRNQACGPGHKERRQVWVPAYTKGPDDAPLLERPTVFAWRR